MPLQKDELEALVEKITKFAEHINEKKFYPYQIGLSKRITRALLTNEGTTLTALFARQSGKTETVAATVAANMELLPFLAQKYEELEIYAKGIWIGVFAPVGEQAVTMFDRVFDVITTDIGKEVLTGELRLPVPAKGGARGNIIKLGNGSILRMHSANRRSKIESKTYHLLVLDESQEIESFMAKKSISPMGAAVNATMVLTGTPAPVIGFFYDQINKNKARDAQITRGLSEKQTHFEVDANEVKRYNKMYEKYLEKEKKSLNEDSDEYQMAYMLKWPITRGMMFTKTILEEKCYSPKHKLVTTFRDYPCTAGLDLGKSLDSTILTILYPDWSKADEEGNMMKYLLDWFELEGDEWESQYPQIEDKLSNYWIETLLVDSTGVGDPIRERLAFMMPDINVAPFIYSPSTKDIGYKYLQKEIVGGRLIVPYNKEARKSKKFRKFEYQMTTLRKNYSGKFLSPKPVDNDKGHDDYPDSLMLAVYATYFDVMPEIDVEESLLFKSDKVNYNNFGQRYSRPRKYR